MDQTLILDFDSTMIKKEALDVLAEISLIGHPQRYSKIARIKRITSEGMNGDRTFEESLQLRLAELNLHRVYVDQTAQSLSLPCNISESFWTHRKMIAKNAEKIFIISGGFRPFIEPVAALFGIDPSHVFANRFWFDAKGKYMGIDWENPLAQDRGKVKIARYLKDSGFLTSPVIAIGDGMTDWQLYEEGVADYLAVFTETARRLPVLEKVQNTTNCFEAKSFHDVASFLEWQPPCTTEGQRIFSEEMAYATPMQQRK